MAFGPALDLRNGVTAIKNHPFATLGNVLHNRINHVDQAKKHSK